jgi:mannose-6-phosphate isomerase-like protein (cupin superfamily)
LQAQGDYQLAILEFPPHWTQRAHYHQYGIIDIFIVIEGEAILHVANHQGDAIIPESRERHVLRAGDTYALSTNVIHWFETQGESLKVMNIAQPQHSLLGENSKSKAFDMIFVDA